MNTIVLGMHRSGTSLLIGLLQKHGYKLGDVSNHITKLKPTGTKENIAIRQINNQILVYNGGCWSSPKSCVNLSNALKIKLKLTARTLKNKWAIKDPRMLITYDLWKNYLPSHALIATIRHPLLVAKSLQAKNGIEIKTGVELWCKYNNRLLNYWNNSNFPILNFDLSKNDYFKQFKKLESSLLFNANKLVFDCFYTHTFTDKQEGLLSTKAKELHEELLDISMNKL